MEAPLRASAYNRVSDDRDGRSKSPQQQNKENLAAIDGEGWTLAATYTEPESASASRFATRAREEWERFRRDLDAGATDVLVVWETSRSSRRMAPFVDLLDACRDKGVLIHVTSHERTYDPRKWRDRKALLEDGIDAEGESEKTSQRVRRDARARAAAGLPNGRLLYGYRREYEYDDNGKRKLLRQIPREDQAAVVREIFTRFAAGESIYRIGLDLDQRGVPVGWRAKRVRETPPEWTPVRLQQLLTNPGYIGKRIHQGEIVGEAAWPRLVEQETWDACQRRLQDRRRRMNRGDVRDKHLLSGVARCATCGAFLRKVPNHSHRMIYQCRGYGGDPAKGRYCTSIIAEVLETHVTGMALLRLSRADARELFTADRSAEAAKATAALLAKQVELEDLHSMVDAGKLTLQALARHEPRLVAEIAALEAEASFHVAPVVHDTAGPDAAERWAQLSLDQRKELLNAIMTIRLHKAQGQDDRVAFRGGMSAAVAARRVEIGWKTA